MPQQFQPTAPDRSDAWRPVFSACSNRPQLRGRAAAAVLRAERMKIRELARCTDLSLRTHAARRIALDASEWASRHARIARADLIASLGNRAAWSHVAGNELACAFGSRQRIVRIPAGDDILQIASMIARTEVRIFLGDAPAPVVTHLQAFAESELQRRLSQRH